MAESDVEKLRQLGLNDRGDHLMRGPSGLSRVEREMIAVVVSKANDCYY